MMTRKIDLGNEEYHRRHKIHRNFLYGIVVILLFMQIATFLILTLQVSKLSFELGRVEEDLASDFNQRLSESNQLFQAELSTISQELTSQKSSFDEEISLLKADTQSDFSGIIEGAVQSVVSVGTEKSAGTGFVVDEEGYIVTNYHVISGARDIRVLTYDRIVLDAELIGFDAFRDIALLKAEDSLKAISLADSDDVQVGNKVIAIGNPLGLSFSVAEGIVSAINREGPNGLNEYIQTDVSLNPGNSGGPLINTKGEVIGVNNFKVGGNTEGLGFALESDSIRTTVNGFVNGTIIE